MTLLAGDVFLGTPGHRESPRWVVGGVPKHGLVPGKAYWLLSECGLVGDLVASTSHAKTFLGRAKYLGAVTGDDGQIITLQRFAVSPRPRRQSDHGAPVFLIVGTSPEIGKTTTGLAVLRTLLNEGHSTVIALKATGTTAITEIMRYQDYGAAQVFDCLDFGVPSTHPANRKGAAGLFKWMLDTCLAIPADAFLIECGGDIIGLNVPTFLKCLRSRRSHPKVILVASDALGAFGATGILRKMGLAVDLITGPCTDTPAVRQRTEMLCRTATLNVHFNDGERS